MNLKLKLVAIVTLICSASFAQPGNLVVADYYGTNHYNKVQTLPSFTWSTMAEPCTSGNGPHGMTCDTVDQILYEIVHISESASNVHFFRNDFVNNEDVTGYPGQTMYAIAYSHETNKLFTVGMATNTSGATQTLYEIDKFTGALTSVGNLTITGYADAFYPFSIDNGHGTIIGLTWDPVDDVLLATTADSKLYQINPTSGVETFVGNTASAYHGLSWDYQYNALMAKTSGGSVREINKSTGATITTFGSADGQLGMCYAPWAGGTGGALSCGPVMPTACSASTNSFTVSTCGSYTVPSGDETYNVAGTSTVMDTIPNQGGCDSVLTISLTITTNSTNTIAVTNCNSYTVPSGDETYNTPGTSTVMDTIPNVLGCDSVITINLTINSIDNTTNTNQNTITANQSGLTYQWIDCNDLQPITGETNQSFTATQNGDYAVIVSDGVCEDTSACVNVSGLSINQYQSEHIKIFPNPSNSSFNIIMSGEVYIEKVRIVSATGQLVWDSIKTGYSMIVDHRSLPSGLYFVQLISSEKIFIYQHMITD